MVRPDEMHALPGGEMIERGIEDLRDGRETTESLTVAIGAPRLRRIGFEVRACFDHPEHRLYLRLADEHGQGAHSAYNAIVRRLVSFERAAECAR